LLAKGETVAFTQNADGLLFTLPSSRKDTPDTIVALRLDQPVIVSVRAQASKSAFGDTVAYGEVVFTRTNIIASAGEVELDVGKARKITAVVVEQESESLPLKLSLSSDNQTWNQVAIIDQCPKIWEVTIQSHAQGAILPGQNARYLRIQVQSKNLPVTLRRVEAYGF
jgi:hypothetical protein